MTSPREESDEMFSELEDASDFVLEAKSLDIGSPPTEPFLSVGRKTYMELRKKIEEDQDQSRKLEAAAESKYLEELIERSHNTRRQANTSSDKKKVDLNHRLEELVGQVKEKNRRIVQLEAESGKTQRELLDLQETVTEKDKIIAAKVASITVIQSNSQKELFEKEEELKSSQRKVLELLQKCGHIHEQIANKEKEMVVMQKRHKENEESLRHSFQEEMKDLENQMSQSKNIEIEIADLKGALEEASSMEKVLKTQNLELEDRITELAEVQEQLKKSATENETLKAKLKVVLKKKKEMISQDEVNSKVATLQNRIAELEEEKGNLQLQLVDYDEQQASQTSAVDKLNEAMTEISSYKTDALEYTKRIELMESEIASYRNDSQVNLNIIGQYESQLTELHNSTEAELVQMRIRIIELEEMGEKLTSEKREMHEEMVRRLEIANNAIAEQEKETRDFEKAVPPIVEVGDDFGLRMGNSTGSEESNEDTFIKVKRHDLGADKSPTCTEHETTISSLRQQLEDEEAERSEMIQGYQFVSSENERLSQEIEKFRVEKRVAEETVNEYCQKLSSAELKLSEADQNMFDLLKAKETKEDELKSSSEKYKALEDKLKLALVTLKQRTALLKQLQEKDKSAKESMSESLSSSMLTTSTTEHSDATKQVEELQSELAQSNSRISELESCIASLKTLNEESLLDNQRTEMCLASTNNELVFQTQRNSELNESIRELDRVIIGKDAEMQIVMQNFEELNQSVDAKLESLNDCVASKDQEVQELIKKYDLYYDSSQELIRSYENAKVEMEEILNGKNVALEDCQTMIESHQEEVNQLEQKLKSCHDVLAKYEENSNAEAQKYAQLQEYQSNIHKTIEQTEQVLSEKDNTIESMRAEIQSKDDQVYQLRGMYDSAMADLQLVHNHIQEMNTRLQEQSLETERQLRETIAAENEEAAEQLKQSYKSLEAMKNETINNLVQETMELKARLNSYEEIAVKNSKEVEEYRENIDALKILHTCVQAELERSEQNFQHFKEQHSNYDKARNEQMVEYDRIRDHLEQQLTESAQNSDILKSQLDTKMKECEKAEQNLFEKSEEIVRLHEKLSEVQENHKRELDSNYAIYAETLNKKNGELELLNCTWGQAHEEYGLMKERYDNVVAYNESIIQQMNNIALEKQSKEVQLAQLTEQIQNTLPATSALSDLQQELDTVRASLLEKEIKIVELEVKLTESQSVVDEEEFTARQTELSELKISFEVLQNENMLLREENSKLRRELEEVRLQSLFSRKETATDSQTSISTGVPVEEEVVRTSAYMTTDKSIESEVTEEARTKEKALNEEIRELKVKNGKAIHMFKQLKDKYEKLVKEYESTKSKKTFSLDNTIEEELTGQIKEKDEKLEENKREISELLSQKEKMSEKLELLEKANEKLIDMYDCQGFAAEQTLLQKRQLEQEISGLKWRLEEAESAVPSGNFNEHSGQSTQPGVAPHFDNMRETVARLESDNEKLQAGHLDSLGYIAILESKLQEAYEQLPSTNVRGQVVSADGDFSDRGVFPTDNIPQQGATDTNNELLSEKQEMEILERKIELLQSKISEIEISETKCFEESLTLKAWIRQLEVDYNIQQEELQNFHASAHGGDINDVKAKALQAQVLSLVESLHDREKRCEQLTVEITQLLEERDSLQLKLSTVLKQNVNLHEEMGKDLSVEKVPSFNTEALRIKLAELENANFSMNVDLRREREARRRVQEQLFFSQTSRLYRVSRPPSSPGSISTPPSPHSPVPSSPQASMNTLSPNRIAQTTLPAQPPMPSATGSAVNTPSDMSTESIT